MKKCEFLTAKSKRLLEQSAKIHCLFYWRIPEVGLNCLILLEKRVRRKIPLQPQLPASTLRYRQLKHQLILMRFFLSFVLVFLFMTACNDDAATGVSAAATVEGSWELVQATRNNVETGLLEGLTYNFRPDGSLETNLMGNETIGTYVWEGTEIVTEGVKLSLTYQIRELTDSTLNLRSKYQSYQFDFKLKRGIPASAL